MLKRIFYALLLVFGVIALGGCVAVGAESFKMVPAYSPAQKPVNPSLVRGISVSQVTGGNDTNPLWMSKISNQSFKAALEQSLQQVNLYHQYGNAKYNLTANIIKIQQPMIGLDLTVTCEVNYLLKNVASNRTIYHKTITSSFTATTKDAFAAVTRLQIANEGAARNNIQQLLKDLYHLPNR